MDRIKKIEIDLQREISFIINTKVKDPRVGFITITYVKLSADYHYMDVYFTVMDKDENLKACLEGLNKSKGFIKKLAGKLEVPTSTIFPFVFEAEEKSFPNLSGLEKKLIDIGSKMQLHLIRVKSKKLKQHAKG